ncbi:MAG TPA: GNAT family N-acetyltransferase [Spirochaetota bacterium]|nr:GNAT family N-acetyltransferase [Spirochaetota bacterium]HPI89509.1 GNAT family N-acetyltransferase [Spirochaetota bacterium]HPR47097.1 GNAT family N-acetyltransferase [Spirochaetota bacterium]
MHSLNDLKKKYAKKFAEEEDIFSNIHRGDRIFISTACGEPQYLVKAMINYIESNPKAFAEAEVMHIWTLGVAPYADENYTYNFRHNSFFVGDNTRDSVNTGLADYTPIFLSEIPRLIYSKRIPIDIALIQTSLPDKNGFVSMGISVDICRAAIDNANIIIAQINKNMPRVHGNTFINIDEIDFIIHHDEPLLEYSPQVPSDIALQIGKYVSKIINDGDTIQVGYGSTPNAILNNISKKNDLGIHTELLTDSMVDLIKSGVINNSKKNINRGKTIASFCMGTEKSYRYIDDNPLIEFRGINYTNDPRIISQIENMTAINAALQIDLTGQATAESIGKTFYSGIGGSADFMRGAVLAPGGKTILVIQSTARNGEVSRIVPFLDSGAGVTMNRGDIHYVVSEYGIAYIHGKNIRERAMSLIAIAHPKFRAELIEEAKKLNLIYRDQAFIPGKKGEYPEYLETVRTTKKGQVVQFRPVKIDDEPLIKDLFYSLSDKSLQRRFMSIRKDVPHKMRQEFVVIDYTKELIILATVEENGKEIAVGMGQTIKDVNTQTAEVAFAVRDTYHDKGIGTELLSYLTMLAKKDGLQGFTADVLVENKPMLHVFEKMDFDLEKKVEYGAYELTMRFK